MRRPVVRRSRGRGPAGPGAKAGDRAGTRAQHSTSPADRRYSNSAATAPLTEAEILVGVTSWLVAARDWFDEEATLARGRLGLDTGDAASEGASLAMRLSDVEKLLRGLGECVRHLDGLAVDPARIRSLVDDAPPKAGNPGWLQ